MRCSAVPRRCAFEVREGVEIRLDGGVHGVKIGALILTAKQKNIIFVNLLGYGMDFSIYSYTLHYGTTDVKYEI